MKNTRTKLTALLLSALMAVSTISSVTWAADLFSDGTDVTASAEFDSEEVESFENEDVLEGGTTDYSNKAGVYWFDPWEEKSPDPSMSETDKRGVYKVDGNGYKVRVRVNGSWSDKDAEYVRSEPATCEHPSRVVVKFTIEQIGPFEAYGYDPDEISSYSSDENHDGIKKYVNITIKDSKNDKNSKYDGKYDSIKCTETKYVLAYTECSICKGILNTSTSKYDKTITANQIEKDVNDELQNTNTIPTSVSNYVKEEEISGTNHVPGKVDKTVVPPESYEEYDYDPSKTPLNKNEWFEQKANCREIKNDQFSGAIDPKRDAFYYEVTYCAKCNEVISVTKHVFYYAEITEGTEFYIAVENVYGFINKNTGKAEAGRISKDLFSGEPEDVVLENCAVGGVYNLCVVSAGTLGNTSSVVETLTAPAGHRWGKLENLRIDSANTIEDFSNDNRSGDTLIADSKGEIHSKDCSTLAFYYADQFCLNPECKYFKESNPELNEKRQALFGNHSYYLPTEQDADGNPGRYIDPTRTKYIPITDENGNIVDKEHHIESYTDHIQCKICNEVDYVKSDTPDAVVDHTLVQKEIPGTREEATCGVAGHYDRRDTCACGYYDDSTRTTVTISATDKHNFGDNEPYLKWTGDVYFEKGGEESTHQIHVYVGRDCNDCGQFDGNGFDAEAEGENINKGYDISNGIQVKDLVPPKKDPATGIAYRCSTAHATLVVDWVGTLNGKLIKLNSEETEDTVKEDIPVYADINEYMARTAHTPGKPQKVGDQIITYCTVCGDIVSKDPDTTPNVDVPTVSATTVDFDTINVSWTKVDGATAYRLYFRSSDEGISKWTKIRTFTSDTTSYPVNGLTTGSKYRFTVRAEVTQDGKTTLGDYSRKGAVAVPKLTAPEIKSVTASGKTTKVVWSRVDGASGYIVFRNSQRVGTVTKGSKVTWTDKKPVGGAKYQVRAYRTEDKKNYKSDLSVPK